MDFVASSGRQIWNLESYPVMKMNRITKRILHEIENLFLSLLRNYQLFYRDILNFRLFQQFIVQIFIFP